MNKVTIKKTTRCDTRSIEKNFTEEDVKQDTLLHIEAVKKVCSEVAYALIEQSIHHDCTKLNSYLPMFHQALKTGFKGDEFKKLNWWEIHKISERHHLNDHCPSDVNLIDVFEMLVDCVCAGKARTGEVYPINISNETLQKAVENTVELLKENVVVEEENIQENDFEVHTLWSEEALRYTFIARSRQFHNVIGTGKTPDEALKEAKETLKVHIEFLKKIGREK